MTEFIFGAAPGRPAFAGATESPQQRRPLIARPHRFWSYETVSKFQEMGSRQKRASEGAPQFQLSGLRLPGSFLCLVIFWQSPVSRVGSMGTTEG